LIRHGTSGARKQPYQDGERYFSPDTAAPARTGQTMGNLTRRRTMSVQNLIAFALLQLLFAVTPGPAVLLTAGRAAAFGMQAGLRVAAGVLVGNAIYLALSAAGTGLLVSAWPGAFGALKLAGALFLAWRGASAVGAAWTSNPAVASASARVGDRSNFIEGLGCQLANPKSIVFFGALLPMFIQPTQPLLPQYVLLALLCGLIEWPVLAVYASLAALAGRLAPSPRAVRIRQLGSGVCLLAVSIGMYVSPLAGS